MRSIEETQSRWQATQKHSASLADLKRAVKNNGPSSPCLSGCRSLCWKVFLVFGDEASSSWNESLRKSRKDYDQQRDHFLKFIKHPEALAELAVDPLADDPESPWNTVRQDEMIRAEIQLDVQRLPDEANYHDPRIQSMILDILFVYCKLHPGRGGYRQGMHELLAPMVHVVEQDSVDRAAVGDNSGMDQQMLEVLDSAFIEHDAFALFCQLMEHVQAFYHVEEVTVQPTLAAPGARFQEQRSAIVQRSKFIHEVCLQKIDPEVAAHLTGIEILPQIFLIRWVRLLFSREFPFNQFLVLWDTIFAADLSLDLIDLICCTMLIRIRWQLLEADYSVCLQLLLKYPPPSKDHGPQTFVDDALYLRQNFDAVGGAALILKYTGKAPTGIKTGDGSLPTTPIVRGLNSLRERGFGPRSPLTSPLRPSAQQQAGVESLFQGAAKGAKGVLERGEKLGINQAVRDAVGEIRRNMQGFNEARNSSRPGKIVLGDETASEVLAAMERRNKQLAALLEETVTNLKDISMSNLDEKAKSLELIEVAAAKVQFVQIHLEDSSMALPVMAPPAAPPAQPDAEKKPTGGPGKSSKPEVETTKPASVPADAAVPTLTLNDSKQSSKGDETGTSPTKEVPDAKGKDALLDPLNGTATAARPSAPIPTRSTLAQSSFSWMLEPDESAETPSPSAASKSPPKQHKKRHSNNDSRDRNAFLFGDMGAEEDETSSSRSGQMFGMEPIRKNKGA